MTKKTAKAGTSTPEAKTTYAATAAAYHDLPNFSQVVYNQLNSALYAEPGFSDVEGHDLAAALAVSPEAIGGAIKKLVEAGLVFTYASEVNGEHTYQFIDTYAHEYGFMANGALFDPDHDPDAEETGDIEPDAPAISESVLRVVMSDLDDRAVTTIYEALCSLSERIETGLAEAREADAGFDGGEFSGPAHDEMDAEAWERIARIDAASDLLGDTMGARHVTDIRAPEGSTDYAPCSFCGTPTYDRAANYVEGRLVCLPCRTSRDRDEDDALTTSGAQEGDGQGLNSPSVSPPEAAPEAAPWVDNWCKRCGAEVTPSHLVYGVRLFYDIDVLSERHLCADCVLDLMRTDPTCQDVMQYIKRGETATPASIERELYDDAEPDEIAPQPQPEYDPAEDADSEVVASPPEEPITVTPTHGESPGTDLPTRCEMCGEPIDWDTDELGEFVEVDAHLVGHAQCGLDRGLSIA